MKWYYSRAHASRDLFYGKYLTEDQWNARIDYYSAIGTDFDNTIWWLGQSLIKVGRRELAARTRSARRCQLLAQLCPTCGGKWRTTDTSIDAVHPTDASSFPVSRNRSNCPAKRA
jgi:hypothetical protein